MKTLRFSRLALCALLVAVMVSRAAALESDQLSGADLAAFKQTPHSKMPRHPQKNGQAHARHGLPVDSLLNWNDHYFADGFDPDGNPNRHWYTNTVGNPPEHRGTTLINVPIVPVIMDLRNEDGSPRFVNGQPLVSSPEAIVEPVLKSPIFAFSHWSSSSVPTQMIDAFQRASYFSRAKDDWHTLLVPSVKPPRRMALNKGSYLFALNEDGSCCSVIIITDGQAADNAMFPPTPSDTTTIMGAAENAGDITTKDISIFLFYNIVLSDPSLETIFVGYHSWDLEPADPSNGKDKYYVMAWVTWASDDLFVPGPFDSIKDISTLSHELAEIMNDPFVNTDFVQNITPWWLAPNGNCDDHLEVGDGAELLPNSAYPITMNGMTYHPQNLILVPWFKREFPSSALHNAYSYPNESVITNLSPPQKANCQ
jgi:hypothetical protein